MTREGGCAMCMVSVHRPVNAVLFDNGRCSPAILLWIFFINSVIGSKDCRWCLPAIESIAGIHILKFYRSRDVFSRYCIYHFEDFTCVHPVSIDSGKTHQKSPAHTSVFRGFFAICVWQIFKTGWTISFPHHHPAHYTNMFCIFMLFRPSFTNTEGGKGWNWIWCPPICLKSAKNI